MDSKTICNLWLQYCLAFGLCASGATGHLVNIKESATRGWEEIQGTNPKHNIKLGCTCP